MDTKYWGAFAGALLFLFYVGILTSFNSFDHALEQLHSTWYYIVPLIIGFGTQVALYMHLRRAKCASASVATSGGASAGSMVACCAHHAIDVLPFFSASVGLFIVQYQPFLMMLGVLSNIMGISFMLRIMQQQGTYPTVLRRVMKWNMDTVFKAVLAGGIIIILLSWSGL
ncbi:hypothetical protein HY639_03425 [Candidatus Woesearchaeota archaeon]|nr:hypothetical protein [Candidatus Woesearchaeota archaeon]